MPVTPIDTSCDAGPRYIPELTGRGRRQSITFDQQVRLGGGGRQTAPLSKASKTKDFSSMSDAERCSYESDFGGLGESLGENDQYSSLGRNGSFQRRRSTAAMKFLMSPASSSDGTASLTSDSTISPMSEFHTPPNSVGSGNYFGRGVPADAISFGETSPWTQSGSAGILRNRSFSFERSRSRSERTRRKTFSERSANSLADASPASMFLHGFGKKALQKQAPIEPDSEGQEVGSYVLGKQIGSGGFSTVKEAFTIENDVEVQRAVKIVRKRVYDNDADNDQVQAAMDAEVSLWRYLHHPNILKLISVFDTPFATFAFMPLNRDGCLFELMKRRENRQGLSAGQARRYCFQIACAVRYLHEDMRIAHGDIKLENCLVDMTHDAAEGGNILLCDFGLAKFISSTHEDSDPGSDPASRRRRPRVVRTQLENDSYCITGSLPYSAPETITPKSDDECNPAADIWSFAVTAFALYTGVLPFHHALPAKLAEMILEGMWDVETLRGCRGLVEAGREEMEMVVEAVGGGLCTDVAKRWTIRDVVESPWLESFYEHGL